MAQALNYHPQAEQPSGQPLVNQTNYVREAAPAQVRYLFFIPHLNSSNALITESFQILLLLLCDPYC